MKKILFLFSIVLLCSCNAKSDGSNTIYTKEDTVPFSHVEVFKYKGHSYIKFIGNNRVGVGVVHDPDCQYCYDKFD